MWVRDRRASLSAYRYGFRRRGECWTRRGQVAPIAESRTGEQCEAVRMEAFGLLPVAKTVQAHVVEDAVDRPRVAAGPANERVAEEARVEIDERAGIGADGRAPG